LRLALVLVFPTIGLEQWLHTNAAAFAALPLYEALHWFSDSLLALPLAALAVWTGQRVAAQRGFGTQTLSDVFVRAGLIAVLFALVLVPGAALHEAADRLTHAHSTLSIHSHVPAPSQSVDGLAVVRSVVVHAVSDGFTAQALGLPLLILAMSPLKGRSHTCRPVAPSFKSPPQ
jgi:hypothetical protein